MTTHADDPHSGKNRAAIPVANRSTPAAMHTAGNGSGAIQLRPYEKLTTHNDKITQQKALQTLAGNQPVQKKENKTGMPDQLKNGIENISGYSMDDVRVHYNSAEPAQLQALAYAKGTDIHIGPGQEQHLAHEAWHVVQQKQGRVQATTQLKQGIPVNDDKGLEQEADLMGRKAMQLQSASPQHHQVSQLKQGIVQRISIDTNKLNMVGEEHNESQVRRPIEIAYCNHLFGRTGLYWQEAAFKPIEIHETKGDEAGLRLKFFYHVFAGSILKCIQTTKDGGMPYLMAVRSPWKTMNTVKVLYQQEVTTLSHEEGTALHEMVNSQEWTGLQAGMDGLAVAENAGNLQYRKKVVEDMIKLKTYWENKPAIYEPSKAVVTDDRNDHMHNSATTAAFQGRVGIWKVGDNHITGIGQMHPTGRHYNLVSRANFNNDLQGYIQSNTSTTGNTGGKQ